MMANARWRVMFAGAAGFGVCELVLAPLHTTALAGTLLFICGVFFTSYSATSNTAIQLASADYIRGRVLGLYYYAWNGLAPFGALLVGYMCDHGGTQLAFYVGGGSALCMTALGVAAVKHPPRPLRPAAVSVAEQLAA
jgi:MFS family permease